MFADRAHLSRAHLLFKRCFSGTVQMVPDSTSLSGLSLVREVIYQTGAYVKAEVVSGC